MTDQQVSAYYTQDRVKVGDFIARTGGSNDVAVGLFAAGELPEVIKVDSGMLVKLVRGRIVYA